MHTMTQTARLTMRHCNMQPPNQLTYTEVSADAHASLPANHRPTHTYTQPTATALFDLPTLPVLFQSISPTTLPTPPPTSRIQSSDIRPLPLQHATEIQTHLHTQVRTHISASTRTHNIAGSLPSHSNRIPPSTSTTTQRNSTHAAPYYISTSHASDQTPIQTVRKQPSTTTRPERRTLRQPLDIDINSSYGDSIHTREPSTIRIFFQNVKGLTCTTTGEDYGYYFSSVSALGADIIGMAETNSAWTHFHLRQTFHASARKQYHSHKVSFSSPSAEVDPIPEKESYQSGGTLTLATNNLVPMALGDNHNDQSGLGQWSTITLRGQEDRLFTIITAYRVCQGNIQSSPVGSSFSREYVHHKQNGASKPQPRTIFLKDITAIIQKLQHQSHAMHLMMDSNGSLTDDNNLQQLLTDCNLSDLHAHAPSPSTYIGSSQQRIDHMLGCPQTYLALTSSGSLSYTEGPQSDHRGLFIDLSMQTLLKRTIATPSILSSPSRSLKSGNPEAVATYHEEMLKYYAEHKMVTRLEDIITAQGSISTSPSSSI